MVDKKNKKKEKQGDFSQSTFLELFTVISSEDSVQAVGKAELELTKRLQAADDTSVIHHGLMQYRDTFKQWHIRHFYLTKNKLAFGKDDVSADTPPEDVSLPRKAESVIELNGCRAKERQSQKFTGSCFVLSHPTRKIYQTSMLSHAQLILATDKEADAKVWLAALQASIASTAESGEDLMKNEDTETESSADADSTASDATKVASETLEAAHAKSPARKGKSKATKKATKSSKSLATESAEEEATESVADSEVDGEGDAGLVPTTYEVAIEPHTVTDDEVNAKIEEDLDGANQSVAMELLKQVKPGMDLSKVVLPTFILEPRSMLEKLSDAFSHTELLLAIPKVEDPVERMVAVVRWYMSSFYIRPKGVKKPYNPIIGETFRCAWDGDAESDSPTKGRTYLVAEQTSHHPPISCFYAANRACEVVVSGAIKFGSSFYGTYTRAILKGYMSMVLTGREGERYTLTYPDTDAKGFILGPLTMEMVGKVQIVCEKTGLVTDMAFKGKPMMWGEYNVVTGTIKRAGESKALYTVDGKWDRKLMIKEVATKQEEVLFDPVGRTRRAMLKPTWEEMGKMESNKLWKAVGEAIVAGDQQKATDEKHVLEQDQRAVHKHLKETNTEWVPKLFAKIADGSYEPSHANPAYVYRYERLDAFDPTKEGVDSLVEVDGELVVRERLASSSSGSTKKKVSKASSKSLASKAVAAITMEGSASGRKSRRKGSNAAATASTIAADASATAVDAAKEAAASAASAVSSAAESLDDKVARLEATVRSLTAEQQRLTAVALAAGGGGGRGAVSIRSALAVLIVALYAASAYNVIRWFA